MATQNPIRPLGESPKGNSYRFDTSTHRQQVPKRLPLNTNAGLILGVAVVVISLLAVILYYGF